MPDLAVRAPADNAFPPVDWDADTFVFDASEADPATDGAIRFRLRPRAPLDSEPWKQDLVPALGALEGEYENGSPAGPDHGIAAGIGCGIEIWGDPFWG